MLPLLFLTLVTLCAGEHWLMEGDFIPASEAESRRLHVESTNSTTSVSSYMRLTLSTPPGHRINCVMAAALHMNGDVSLVDGGIGSSSVTLAYEAIDGKADLFFVLIESHVDEMVWLKGRVALNSRVTILYDRMRDWQAIAVGQVVTEGVEEVMETR